MTDARDAVEVADAYRDYLQALYDGDRRRAAAVIERMEAARLDLPTVYLEVFQPALREVGRLWQENRLTVAQEHLATGITHSLMLRLYLAQGIAAGKGPTLLAACAETERHEIGLRMVCDLLDLAGWETVYLGASVPAESLVQMARERRPEVVALSASITPHLPQLRSMIAALRAAIPDRPPLILVGGRPFLEAPELAATIGADLTAADAVQAVRMLKERFG